MTSRGGFLSRSPLGSVAADASTVVFRNAAEPYTVQDLGSRESVTIRLSPDLAREVLEDAGASVSHVPRFTIASAPVTVRAALLHRTLLRDIKQADRGDPLQREEAALDLVGEVVRASVSRDRFRVPPRLTGLATARVVEARAFLSRTSGDCVRLADVATHVGCSPWHLSRAFRAATGESVRGYVLKLRLQAALLRVLDSSQDLTNIAFECGFSDHSHLTVTFRKRFGVTPSRLRGMSLRQCRALLA